MQVATALEYVCGGKRRLKDHLFDTSIEKTLSENSSLVGCVSDDV